MFGDYGERLIHHQIQLFAMQLKQTIATVTDPLNGH